MEGHGAILFGRTLFEGQFHKGKRHGPGRQIKTSSNSSKITILEGNYVENLAQGLFKQIKITNQETRISTTFHVEDGCYKLD